ncbi:MAG: MFS transporter [Firmicutes bacterium]|nr:MFS transporter [Bacillota bacterium]
MTEATDAPAGRRMWVVAGLMLSTALAAMDGTIVATAIPSIVADLGGFALFPWMFSAYLLLQAVTVPIYSKLADLYGRKPVLFFGVTVFVLGSLLCGLAWSMPALIVFRALQGVGAGAVLPITTTIVGDIFSVEERARIQGYFSSVWGISAIVAPAVGGLFVQYGSWRWAFLVNLPIGALAAWTLVRHLRERVAPRRHRIDAAGALALAAGAGGLVFGCLQAGGRHPGGGWTTLAAFAFGAVALAVFVAVERRAAEPVLPLGAFREPMLAGANFSNLVLGMVVVGLSSYIPTFVQGVLGGSPLVGGLTLGMMSVGWPLASSLSGRAYLRFGFRSTAQAGAALCAAGGAVLLSAPATASALPVALGCFITGAGLGLATTSVLVAVQAAVEWEQRGMATGAMTFMRMLGSTLGAAVYGGIVNATVARALAEAPAAVRAQLPAATDVTSALLERSGAHVPPHVLGYLRAALDAGVHHVFLVTIAAALVALAFVSRIPARVQRVRV